MSDEYTKTLEGLKKVWSEVDAVMQDFSQRMNALSKQMQDYVESMPYKPQKPTPEDEERMFTQAKGSPENY